MENDVEIEIDLRRYFDILLRYWLWIVGIAVIFALAALVWSSVQPLSYEAVALIAIKKTQYTVTFDPRLTTVASAQTTTAYPELAKSDDLVQSVYAKLDPRPASIKTPGDLGRALTAQAGSDPSLFRLRVQAQNPGDAARIANLWADTFITRANELYSTQDQSQVQLFETQASSADKELQAAEQAIIDYQAHDQTAILQNQLDSLKQMQVETLASQRNTTSLLQDIATLRAQLSKQPAGNSAGLADRLTALSLQIRAYKAQASVPIQLQFSSSDAIISATVGEQVAFLDSLNGSVQAQLSQLDARVKEPQPQILALQQQLQQISAQKDRLTRARDV
ncbi:MAG TPA: Wzz/FepE/Etk N-terminal domain-containing protein, partial [Anaerolineae bacterium]